MSSIVVQRERTSKHAAYVMSSQCRKDRGKRLSQARHSLGLTLDAFAVLLSTSRGTLTKLENGETDTKVKHLELAAHHSGFNVLWLMFGDVYKHRNIETKRDYYE